MLRQERRKEGPRNPEERPGRMLRQEGRTQEPVRKAGKDARTGRKEEPRNTQGRPGRMLR